MGPTTTPGATTTSGWPEARRSRRTCCRSSRRCSRRTSTHTLPSGCGRCESATRLSSRGMGAESARPRLLELAQRYKLTTDQRERLEDLLSALDHDAHAPTSVRCPRRAVDIHVADSLVALELEVVARARAIADLGSGAGFPGLALAVALARAEVRLIESNMRKCAYLQRVVAETGVRNARVVCARAEDWRDGEGSNDVVLARALA